MDDTEKNTKTNNEAVLEEKEQEIQKEENTESTENTENIGEEKEKEDIVPQADNPEDVAIMEGMIKAGICFGHKKSKGHPKMFPYIYATRNNIQVIDVSKTLSQLNLAVEFLRDIVKSKGNILFVGTQPSAKELVKNIASELNMPYVNERWLGGTMTNFHTIKKRVNYFHDLEKKKASGELEKYTKKERLLFDRELAKLEKNFGGIRNMEKLPNVLFIVDIKEHDTAVREAKREKIPIVAVCDTNVDPTPIDYVIPSNDNSYKSIQFILEKIKADIRL